MNWKLVAIRAGLVVLAILAWWWTQALLGKRVPKSASSSPLTDGIHILTAGMNARLVANVRAANLLLISSSLVIDLLGLTLLGAAIFGQSFRPFVGLVMVFGLRQICQLLCPLPAPEGMIWRSPGVPSILVTYGTSSDLFFSGHTAIAIFGALTLPGLLGPAGIVLGIAIAVFEVVTVLILRAHYTTDVFTGLVTAILVYMVADNWAGSVDAFLARIVG